MSDYHPIQIKRIYEDPTNNDGYRVLVDRLWPRGVSKEDAQLDDWMKKITPSTELRKWFDHDPAKFDEFKKRYKNELDDKEDLLDSLIKKSSKKKVTLLYAAKDEEHNHALVIVSILKNRRNKV